MKRLNLYMWVDVPVIIEAGHTTTVHLDDRWKIPSTFPKSEVVCLPDDNFVGWRAGTLPH